MPPTESCLKGVELEQKIKSLRYDFDEFKSEIKADIKEIKEKLLGRPTWFVLILITGLFTAVGAMAMYIITL